MMLADQSLACSFWLIVYVRIIFNNDIGNIKLCFIIIIWISFGWFKLMGTRRLPRRCFHVEILAVYIYYSYGLKSKIFVGSNILNFCVREKTFLEWWWSRRNRNGQQ
jgi:hypothetical protein